MRDFKTWRKKLDHPDGGGNTSKMKSQLPFMGVACIVMLFIVYRTTNYQYQRTEMEERLDPFDTGKNADHDYRKLDNLPRGIIEARSDLELKPLWTSGSKSKTYTTHSNLLAIAAGIKQKINVNAMVQKFLSGNFTIVLFHYDGNVDGWFSLDWAHDAIHIVARNQTKWWFAKRFLHPDIVSIYDYIFLWDEDLGLEHFSPQRYLDIVRSEGLEISQPALDPKSLDIHHRITVRRRTNIVHRRVYENRGNTNCSNESMGPPCTGFIEGMAPVFSRAAWYCAWHLIQNDLVHGWGMDMKLGYCAQGDRREKVGVVDREYILHKGIQTLGGTSSRKVTPDRRRQRHPSLDTRTEIRRQSTHELQIFEERWEKAISEDKNWVDPTVTPRKKQMRKILLSS
ncbi:hypothetical protein QQ045_008147 [Rhodiola kirilowii]